MMAGSKLFPPEVHGFFRSHNQGKSAKDMAALLNQTFGTSYTVEQIKAYRARQHWNSGLTGRFEKGHVPQNKGRKGQSYPGMEASQFKTGHRPHNALPVGTELVNTDGYLVRKIAEPNVWKPVHILNWEAVHGPVPANHALIFKDKDHANCALDNLLQVTRAELAVMNRRGLITENPEATETGRILAKLISATSNSRKKLHRGRSK